MATWPSPKLTLAWPASGGGVVAASVAAGQIIIETGSGEWPLTKVPPLTGSKRPVSAHPTRAAAGGIIIQDRGIPRLECVTVSAHMIFWAGFCTSLDLKLKPVPVKDNNAI